MSDLTAGTIHAEQHLAVEYDSAANTCSKCYHYQIAVALATALPHLSERSDICVISSLYRISDQLLQLVLNIQYSPSEVYTLENRSILLDRSRDSDSNALNIFLCKLLAFNNFLYSCLLYTSPSPRDA